MIWQPEFAPVALTPDISLWKARDWRNHPAVWQWCRQHTLISEADQMAWKESHESDPSIKMFGVETAAKPDKPSTAIGVCGFTSINPRLRSAEFSLYIAPSHQAKGFGKKALALLVDHGFNDWGFRRIWGEVFEKNPAYEMFKKIGFHHEGTLRSTYFKKGKFIDSHIVSLLDTDARWEGEK
jgi:ribosomal-protein-alanine N-acetyltransferase